MRNTRQRAIILEELRGLHSHPSADELYARVRRRIPRISLGTVYRNLDNLAKQGIIRTLELGGSVKRFDGDTSSHEHVRCVVCGRIDDLGGDSGIIERDRALVEGAGYRFVERRAEFLAVCPICIEKEKRGGSIWSRVSLDRIVPRGASRTRSKASTNDTTDGH